MIKTIRSDNGTEYTNNEFISFLLVLLKKMVQP